MKKAIVLLCGLLLCVLAGCSNLSTYQTTQVENVTISISDVSPTGATVTVKDTNAPPHIYGEWYKIEKEIDGQWYDVDTVISNGSFEAIGYVPNHSGEVVFSVNWKWLYGKLPNGNYRLLKQVGDQYIAVTFSIGTP